MKPNFSWKKASYDYEIELANHASYQEETKAITELLIYAGFGANLYMSMMMGE